jgi:hypothetical protein
MAQPITISLRLDGKTQVLQGLAQVSAGIRGAFASVAAPIAAVAGIGAITEAIRRSVTVGVSFNATLENAKLSIAAVQRQLSPERFRTFDDALSAAGGTLEQLKAAAKESPASFEELVQGFQSITGAATAAGIPLEKQVNLTVRMSQALAGLGIPTEQLRQETQALITGRIDMNAVAAKTLQITAADIAQARQQGQLYEFLTGKLAAFGEAGKRSGQTLTVMWSNLKDALQQAAGVAFLPVFDEIKRGLGVANTFNFDGMAKNIAAYLELGFGSVRDGTWPRFIALSVQSGFELGLAGVKNTLAGFFNFTLGELALYGGVVLATSITKALVNSFTHLFEWMAQGFITVAELAGKAIAGVFNKFIGLAEGALNNLMTKDAPVNRMLATALGGKVDFGRIDTSAGDAKFAELRGMAADIRQLMSDQSNEFFDRGANAAGELLGFGRTKADDLAATRELNGLVEERVRWANEAEGLAKRDRDYQAEVASRIRVVASAQKVVVDYVAQERGLRQDIVRAKQAGQLAEGNFRLTEAEKFAARKEALETERAKLAEIVALLEKRRALAIEQGDTQAAEQIAGRIDSAENQIGSVDEQRGTMGPDPASYGEQFGQVFTELREMATITASDIARTFRTVIQSAVDGIAGSIGGLIRGTMTWGQALQNIGSSILNGVIDAIAKMFAEWIVGRLAVKAVEIASSGAEAVAKAPGALMTSISSFGVAAALGVAGLIAAIAAISGAFAEGGRPPSGRPALVGELGPELFVPDSAGRIIPADATAALLAGQPAGMGGGSAAAVGGGATVNLAAFDTREDARRWSQSQEAEVWFVDMANRTASRWKGGA